MSISSPITEQLVHDLDKALQDAATGKRDPDKMAKALEAMQASVEETRKRIGTVSVAVDLIRELRDQ